VDVTEIPSEEDIIITKDASTKNRWTGTTSQFALHLSKPSAYINQSYKLVSFVAFLSLYFCCETFSD
jgi:hypothetical protein